MLQCFDFVSFRLPDNDLSRRPDHPAFRARSESREASVVLAGDRQERLQGSSPFALMLSTR